MCHGISPIRPVPSHTRQGSGSFRFRKDRPVPRQATQSISRWYRIRPAESAGLVMPSPFYISFLNCNHNVRIPCGTRHQPRGCPHNPMSSSAVFRTWDISMLMSSLSIRSLASTAFHGSRGLGFTVVALLAKVKLCFRVEEYCPPHVAHRAAADIFRGPHHPADYNDPWKR